MSFVIDPSSPGMLAGHGAADIAALILRVTLGALFIAHIYWKLAILDGGFAAWWSRFRINGYHWIVPCYVVSAEILAAACLIPGIHTRLVCLYALPLMLGAVHFWYVRKGFFFTVAGCELPAVWAVMLLVQSVLGDGAFALGPSYDATRQARPASSVVVSATTANSNRGHPCLTLASSISSPSCGRSASIPAAGAIPAPTQTRTSITRI